jgi:ABC-type sugar transport system substrate-binding protein
MHVSFAEKAADAGIPGSRSREQDGPGRQEGELNRRVLVSLLSEEQDFQVMQAEDAREVGRRLDLDVEVVFAESHAVMQIQQLFKAIHAPEEERPAAIVVEPTVGEGFERVARNATRAGMGWILLDVRASYIDELRTAHPKLAVGMIGADQEEVGRIQGRQCRALLPDGGRVLSVQGPADATVTHDRSEGLHEVLGEDFEVRVLNGSWTADSGDQAVMSWLRLKTAEAFQPEIVAAQNDLMGIGVRKALTTNRPDWAAVPYLGCDGLLEGGRKQVDEGNFAGTVITPSNTGPALEVVERWLGTGEVPPRELILRPESYPPLSEIQPWGES